MCHGKFIAANWCLFTRGISDFSLRFKGGERRGNEKASFLFCAEAKLKIYFECVWIVTTTRKLARGIMNLYLNDFRLFFLSSLREAFNERLYSTQHLNTHSSLVFSQALASSPKAEIHLTFILFSRELILPMNEYRKSFVSTAGRFDLNI